MLNSLSFEVVIETSMDDFTFKVPYLLNLLLNESSLDFDEEDYENTKLSCDELIMNIVSYDEKDLSKFDVLMS